MRLNLIALLLNCLIVSTVAQTFRQHLHRRASDEDDKTPSKSKDTDGSKGEPSKDGSKGGDGSDKTSNKHHDAGSSAVNGGGAGGGRGRGAEAAQSAPQEANAASSTHTVSQTAAPGEWSNTNSAAGTVTSASSNSNANASSGSNSSATSSSSAASATTSQTTKVVHKKINMTLAEMPYTQIMCRNNSEVQSGSVINATWLSKGAYTNTVYLRYGLDNYQAWNTAPGGTLPPFAGTKLKGNQETQDPDASYRMTFQTQVFAYQKGITLSILIFDNQKNSTVVTFESPSIAITNSCEKDKDELEEARKEIVEGASQGTPEGGNDTRTPDGSTDDGDDADDAAAVASSSSSSSSNSPTSAPERGKASQLSASPTVLSASIFALFSSLYLSAYS